MHNRKLTLALTISGLITTTLGTLFAINKTVSKIATSKNLLTAKNKELYHWRFGDIYYSVTGEGKPILLVHNLKEDSSSIEWSELIPRLSKKYTVYAVDLLGCGLSERPDITYTSYMYTQLVNDFIRNVIKRKTNVVAAGRSASFVLEACSINGDEFEDIVLINPDSIRNFRKAPSKRTRSAVFILKFKIIGTFLYHIIAKKKHVQQDFEDCYYYDREHIPEALVDYYYESAHIGGTRAKNLYISLKGRYTNVNVVRALKEIDNNIHILASTELPDAKKNMKEYQYYNPAIEVEYLDYVKELPQLEAPSKITKYLDLYLSTYSAMR